MWIKNVTVFVAKEPLAGSVSEWENALETLPCPPCGEQMQGSEGFVAPLKQDGRLVMAIGDYLYCTHQEITRLLPGPVITETLAERVEQIQERDGRPVGRKEKVELKEQIIFELLPRAFTRTRRTGVLIDLARGRILVDTPQENRAEQIIVALRKALGSLPVVKPKAVSANSILTHWLQSPETLPDDIGLGDRCELKATQGDKASVRFTAVDLSQDDVLSHLAHMQVARLNLSWHDEIEFDLQDNLVVKRLKPLDILQDNIQAIDADDAVDELLAMISLQGATLRALFDRLLSHFEHQEQAAA